MNYFLPVIAVLLGYLFVIIVKPKNKGSLKLILAFSGAFLLSLTVFDLLPEVYEHASGKDAGIFIMLGILLQVFLEFFSKGAEHGHVHMEDDLKSFPWLLFISLSIHSFLEGFPIHNHENFVFGIVIHKFPIAVILSSFFINSNVKKSHAVAFLILFALTTPLGTLAEAKLDFLKPYYTQISALVIGIFLHISTIILFESTQGHKFNASKLVLIVLGIVTAYFL